MCKKDCKCKKTNYLTYSFIDNMYSNNNQTCLTDLDGHPVDSQGRLLKPKNRQPMHMERIPDKLFSDSFEFINNSGFEFKDISHEEYRIYTFSDMEIKINEPLKLNVSKSGGHRIFDANGISRYIPSGWREIQWKAKKGQPNFDF